MRSVFEKWPLAPAALIALLASIGVLGAYNTWRVDEHRRRVAHTHEVIAGLERAQSLVGEVESAQRGYLITGDDAYLEPYHATLASIDGEFDHLAHLTADNPSQQARFADVREKIDARLRTLRANLELRRNAGFDTARQGILTGRGKFEMDAVRAVVTEMIDHERELLQERTIEADRATQLSTLSHVLATIAAVAGVWAYAVVVRRNTAVRAAAAREVAEHAERLRTTLASIGDGVIATDTQDRVTMMNPVAEALTGWSFEDARGRPVESVFRIVNDETRHTVPNPATRARREGAFVSLAGDDVLIAQDGRERPIDDSASPIRDKDGEMVGCVLVFRDVTARREADRALSESESALRRADRRKDEFLATLAHELRNPLAPMRNAAQFLLLKMPPDPELRWSGDVIERQVRHMTRLLDDLLDVSRITHDKLELRKERVELGPILRSAIETSRPVIESGGHELVVDLPREPIHLHADPVRLAQVFANLLNNAAKYTESGGHLRVRAERCEAGVAISVKDDGMGIDAEMLPRVFDIFVQSKLVHERSQGGLGVGLSLVRGLVELHGGRVEAHSDGPGTGSEFNVHLPLADAALTGAAAVEPPSGAATSTKRRILIVDDVRDGAESLAMLLRSLGHEVRTAQDGEVGLAMAETFEPDVVLLDIGMPRMNGYEACRHIRAQPWGKSMFIVALTGWSQEEDRQRAKRAGFDTHMVKPVAPTSLIELFASLPRTTANSPT